MIVTTGSFADGFLTLDTKDSSKDLYEKTTLCKMSEIHFWKAINSLLKYNESLAERLFNKYSPLWA